MKLAYFCDGTWNDPASKTNVYRLYKATPTVAGVQDSRYEDGVGSEGIWIGRVFNGAFGNALKNKVKLAYAELAHLYEPGDQLFFFGFSRGAYTARCLAGMVANCGLPTQNVDADCVDKIWDAYRHPDKRLGILADLKNYALDSKPTITMLGVWDTVGALGIPATWGGVDVLQYGFLDTSLHPAVRNAYQAIAIDEKRAQFPPTLWTNAPADGQTIEQVWFSGVHCDVGGGYPACDDDNNTLLSDITLGWMMSKALALGLQLDADLLASHTALSPRYAINQMNDSYKPPFSLTPPRARQIPSNAVLGNSVKLRCSYTGSKYAPANLVFESGALSSGYAYVPVVREGPIESWPTVR